MSFIGNMSAATTPGQNAFVLHRTDSAVEKNGKKTQRSQTGLFGLATRFEWLNHALLPVTAPEHECTHHSEGRESNRNGYEHSLRAQI